MSKPRPTADDFLRIGPRIRVLPIIHGSGDFAIRVREELLARPYDCLAVPLPPSFQDDVEAADRAAAERSRSSRSATPTDDDAEHGLQLRADRPVPGRDRRAPDGDGRADRREFIDLETPRFEAQTGVFPDPYALKQVSPEGFAAAVLPAIPPPTPRPARRPDRLDGRAAPRAGRRDTSRSCFVCSLLDWPWIRDAYTRRLDGPRTPSRSSRRSRRSPSTRRR